MFATAFSILLVAIYGINGEVSPNYNVCAKENSDCGCTGTIFIGENTAWDSKEGVSGVSKCKHSTLNLPDPAPGKFKYCICDKENLGRTVDLEFCASETDYCDCDGLVWFGFHSSWTHNSKMGSTNCDRAVFGNPRRGPRRECLCAKEILTL